jgi:hypothetical protein
MPWGLLAVPRNQGPDGLNSPIHILNGEDGHPVDTGIQYEESLH